MSTFKASKNLGLETFFVNISENTWSLEFEDGKIMNASNVEHVKDAARVISQYCDIIGVRSFASLNNNFYVNKRWLGGTLTNWNTISHSIKRLEEIELFLKDNLGFFLFSIEDYAPVNNLVTM